MVSQSGMDQEFRIGGSTICLSEWRKDKSFKGQKTCNSAFTTSHEQTRWTFATYVQESANSEEEQVGDASAGEFRSTAKIRGLLSTALTKMSSSRGDLSEMSNMKVDEKQGLLNNLKQRLGSQISLKRRSQDFLNAI